MNLVNNDIKPGTFGSQKIGRYTMPLNGITLRPRQTDPINRMIPFTDTQFGIISKQALEITKKNYYPNN